MARQPRELALYDGQTRVGTIKVFDEGKLCRAFDRHGNTLGMFPYLKAASRAFDDAAELEDLEMRN
jgi:hypothetical protein